MAPLVFRKRYGYLFFKCYHLVRTVDLVLAYGFMVSFPSLCFFGPFLSLSKPEVGLVSGFLWKELPTHPVARAWVLCIVRLPVFLLGCEIAPLLGAQPAPLLRLPCLLKIKGAGMSRGNGTVIRIHCMKKIKSTCMDLQSFFKENNILGFFPALWPLLHVDT